MIGDAKLRAFVQIEGRTDEHNDLKKLALFFDEIYCIPPETVIIKNEVLNNSKHIRENKDGSKELINFNFFRDTRRGLNLPLKELHSPSLRDTILTFIESNVIKEVSSQVDDDQFVEFRGIIASHDVDDKAFNEISETDPKDYITPSLRGVTIQFTDTYETLDLVTIEPPQAITDSWDTTTIIYLAQQTSSFPIFLNSRHRNVMRYRYEQYKTGLDIFQKNTLSTTTPTDFKSYFGEITFNIANSLFTSDLISKKTPEEIVR